MCAREALSADAWSTSLAALGRRGRLRALGIGFDGRTTRARASAPASSPTEGRRTAPWPRVPTEPARTTIRRDRHRGASLPRRASDPPVDAEGQGQGGPRGRHPDEDLTFAGLRSSRGARRRSAHAARAPRRPSASSARGPRTTLTRSLSCPRVPEREAASCGLNPAPDSRARPGAARGHPGRAARRRPGGAGQERHRQDGHAAPACCERVDRASAYPHDGRGADQGGGAPSRDALASSRARWIRPRCASRARLGGLRVADDRAALASGDASSSSDAGR